MELYRRQIEELESHLLAISPETGMSSQSESVCPSKQRAAINPPHLTYVLAAIVEILRLQYKPFLLLAAQLQTAHEQVQNLKEQYLSYRKVFLHSSVDVFEERRGKNKLGKGGSFFDDADPLSHDHGISVHVIGTSTSGSILTGPPPFSVTAMNQPAAPESECGIHC